VTPVVGGLVRGQKGPGPGPISPIFSCGVLTSLHRETPQNVIKENRQDIGFHFFGRFFCKIVFCGVFEILSLRSPEKAIKPKNIRE
jgi:hypothetical protein